jgi:hypothetical protein
MSRAHIHVNQVTPGLQECRDLLVTWDSADYKGQKALSAPPVRAGHPGPLVLPEEPVNPDLKVVKVPVDLLGHPESAVTAALLVVMDLQAH